MKNVLRTIFVLALMTAAGIGGYAVGTHKVKVTSKDTSATTQPAPKTTQTVTKPATGKQLDLNTLLAGLQKQYPTVEQTYVYSQDKDPNGNLGKAGYYTSGAEFYDTRTSTAPDGPAFGADSGGAIEVYANSTDAKKRLDYLKQFQGQPTLDPGAAKQINNVIVRSSSKYNAAAQKQVLDYLVAQVQSQLQ